MSQENVEFVNGFLTGVPEMDKDQLLAALPEVIKWSYAYSGRPASR
jgi:hypothetical protein